MQLPLLPALHTLATHQKSDIDSWNDVVDRVQLHVGNGEYAVGWFTLALINAGLAQGKNRSGFNWFVISVFLGPLATFLLVAFCSKLSYYEE